MMMMNFSALFYYHHYLLPHINSINVGSNPVDEERNHFLSCQSKRGGMTGYDVDDDDDNDDDNDDYDDMEMM